MDIIKILQSVEELIYQIALWVVLLPKTFVKVVRQPRWCYSYVVAEFEKDVKERFGDYMSPILFWVISAILPYLLVLDFLRSISKSTVATDTDFSRFMGLPWATRFIVVAIFALAGPLGFSLLIEKAKHAVIGRDFLRRPFYTQCLCFGAATFFLLPFVAIFLRFNDDIPDGAATVISTISFFTFVFWLFYAEVVLISSELNVSWFKAILRFVIYSLISYCLLFVLELAVITFSLGLRVWTTP